MDRKENILAGAISGAVAAAFVLAIFGNFGARDLNNEGQTDTNGILEEILSNDEFVSQEDLVVSAVKKSQPAVVSVIITKDVPVLEQYYEEYNSPFDDLFGGQGLRAERCESAEDRGLLFRKMDILLPINMWSMMRMPNTRFF
ncbi:hypothetical protein HYW82_00060 [Candidatus Peregrinibacteria bacterium]|nr:hypothetical protein [Candidatus Peregrinibacteria bacterium]